MRTVQQGGMEVDGTGYLCVEYIIHEHIRTRDAGDPCRMPAVSYLILYNGGTEGRG